MDESTDPASEGQESADPMTSESRQYYLLICAARCTTLAPDVAQTGEGPWSRRLVFATSVFSKRMLHLVDWLLSDGMTIPPLFGNGLFSTGEPVARQRSWPDMDIRIVHERCSEPQRREPVISVEAARHQRELAEQRYRMQALQDKRERRVHQRPQQNARCHQPHTKPQQYQRRNKMVFNNANAHRPKRTRGATS